MRPNILFVLIDSARANALRLNGGHAYAPAADRLAAEGVNCPRCWSLTPICHPARTTLITGLLPHAHGMLTNTPEGGGWPFTHTPTAATLPDLLQAAGYRTGYAGQRHIKIAGWTDERHQPTGAYNTWLKAQGYAGEGPIEGQRHWMCGTTPYGLDTTRDGRFGAAGVELLDDLCRGAEPWFAQVDFDGPHPPCWVPEDYLAPYLADPAPLPPTLRDDLAGRPFWVRQARQRQGSAQRSDEDWQRYVNCYHAELTMIDALIGRLLDRLDHHGAAENTLVVFTSDHACPIGYHGFAAHGGPTLYEDVLRVPFLVRWPAGLPAGAVCPTAIEHLDLTPTLLSAAGLDCPPVHGADQLAAFRGEATDHPDANFASYCGTGTAFFSVRAFRDGPWKLIYTPHGEAELYNLDADPEETQNLVGQPAAAAAEQAIRRGMLAEMERLEDPLRRMAKGELQ